MQAKHFLKIHSSLQKLETSHKIHNISNQMWNLRWNYQNQLAAGHLDHTTPISATIWSSPSSPSLPRLFPTYGVLIVRPKYTNEKMPPSRVSPGHQSKTLRSTWPSSYPSTFFLLFQFIPIFLNNKLFNYIFGCGLVLARELIILEIFTQKKLKTCDNWKKVEKETKSEFLW